MKWCSYTIYIRLSVNTSNSATNVRIIFKIGGNIPWVNISKHYFVLNFEFCIIGFNLNKFKSLISQYLFRIFSI